MGRRIKFYWHKPKKLRDQLSTTWRPFQAIHEAVTFGGCFRRFWRGQYHRFWGWFRHFWGRLRYVKMDRTSCWGRICLKFYLSSSSFSPSCERATLKLTLIPFSPWQLLWGNLQSGVIITFPGDSTKLGKLNFLKMQKQKYGRGRRNGCFR